MPEYKGGFPGIFKVFLDYLPFPEALEKKPVSFVGEAAGSFGALRPIEHLQQILIYRKAIVYPERMFIQRVKKNFERGTGIQSEKLEDLLKDQIRGFLHFVDLSN